VAAGLALGGSAATRERWLAALVLALTALVYAPSLDGDWVWDDFHVIAKNPAIHAPWRLVAEDMWGPTGHRNPISVAYYRPLGMLSFYPGQALFGGPLPERLVNLALHLAAVALVAGLARALGASALAAWLGAAAFGWHPAVSEAVAWCSGRFDLLGSAALLGALWAIERGRGGVAGALLFAAPFCKDTWIAAPVVVALWGLARRRDVRAPLASAALGVAAYWAVRGLLAIRSRCARARRIRSQCSRRGWVRRARARAAGRLAGARRARLLHAASRARRAGRARGDRRPCRAARSHRARDSCSRRLPLLALSVPAAAEFGIVGDRYFYPVFALLGVGAALAFDAALLRSATGASPMRWLPAAVAALPLCWAPFAAVRATEWHDNGTLYRASLARDPDNAMAAFNVGHYEQYHRENCADAAPMYERALGRVFEAGTNLDTCLRRLGRLADAAHASRAFAEAYPQLALPARVAADAHLAVGALPDAERWAREAVRRAPEWSGARAALARVLAAEGQRDEALSAYDRALELDPADAEARDGRASLVAIGSDASDDSGRAKPDGSG
jgi:hypothetical protein